MNSLLGYAGRRYLAPLLALGTGTGCWSYNYRSPLGPRYAETMLPVPVVAVSSGSRTLRVVTFNVQYAIHIDEAIALIKSTPALRDADVITLQEMDAPGARRIADALHMAYVYYPACVERKTQRDFGDAILSRWPIVADQKIVLPHLARFGGTARIATAATVLVEGIPIRVYSVHLATQIENGSGSRHDQARTILADAAAYPRVVISGDMNSHGIGNEFRKAGFLWPTEHNPPSHHFFKFDHVFLKGLAPLDSGATGVVHDARGASDHRPVWAVAALPPALDAGSPAAAAPLHTPSSTARAAP